MSAALDRSRPPGPGDFRSVPALGFERRTLAGNFELALAPRRTVPLVTVELLLPGGGERNPLHRPGLSQLTAALLDEGTRRRSGPRIAAELERRGGALATASDWSAASVRLSLPAGDLDFGLELIAELVLEPAFPESEVERLRRQALAELARRIDQPSILAEEAFARALFPGTPFADLLLGTADSLHAIERDEILAFHHAHHRLRGARLVVAGEFDGDHVARRAGELFAPQTEASAAGNPIVAPGRDRVDVVVVDRPRAAQTELRIGHVGVSRVHPDRIGLGFLNSLLGGKFTSRINLNLRERHAVTYGAHSRLVDRRSAGPFIVSAAVANSGVGLAARETLSELARLRDEPVDPAEIEETRSYLLGVFPYGLQSIEGLAAKLRDIALFDLPLDHPLRVLERYRRIDAGELLRLARAHLFPARCLVVAAGPAVEIAPQLEEIGPVSTVEPAR